jgi:hypothetical protein
MSTFLSGQQMALPVHGEFVNPRQNGSAWGESCEIPDRVTVRIMRHLRPVFNGRLNFLAQRGPLEIMPCAVNSACLRVPEKPCEMSFSFSGWITRVHAPGVMPWRKVKRTPRYSMQLKVRRTG